MGLEEIGKLKHGIQVPLSEPIEPINRPCYTPEFLGKFC